MFAFLEKSGKRKGRMAKKGFLDKLASSSIGGIFVESDESQVAASTPQPTVVQVQPVQAVSAVGQMPVPAYVPRSAVDPETKAKIESIVTGADQVSYTKYKELYSAMLETFPGDEVTARKATAKASERSGYPIGDVIKGLDVIIAELNKREEQFKAAVPGKIQAKIGSRRQRISELEQTLKNRGDSIKNLEVELARLRNEATNLQMQVQTETAAISQDEQSVRDDEVKFTVAMQEVKGFYTAERQKLQSHIGGA